MKNLLLYISSAPVISTLFLILISGIIIEINRYFPDPLIFAF
uniref:Photosystem I reaction center subunit IX n=1 Tax=Boodleopsis sp. H.0758 TaxID=2320802 RepID=A0A386AZX4_9CHLO|nr:photosystem I reaction center subunit IX [Boodleopsis sp. H.0758]AYC64963.1 photosystem I reaction center subunit IX [Boodleopsis sp. H.0758]